MKKYRGLIRIFSKQKTCYWYIFDKDTMFITSGKIYKSLIPCKRALLKAARENNLLLNSLDIELK